MHCSLTLAQFGCLPSKCPYLMPLTLPVWHGSQCEEIGIAVIYGNVVANMSFITTAFVISVVMTSVHLPVFCLNFGTGNRGPF